MSYLLTNAEIYAPAPLGVRHVLVGGERILALLDEIPALDPALGVEVVDLGGRRLVPGFVDVHVHVTGGGGEAGFASQVPVLPLSDFTSAGVTSVVGLLGTDDVTRSVENLVARLYALRAEGLSAWGWTGGYHVPPRTLTGEVRRDVVFVDPIVGCAEIALSDHRSSQPAYDELARLAAECHTAGLISGKAGILHLHLGNGTRGLEMVWRALRETEVPPRVFHPTHVNRRRALFDEALEIAGEGVTIDVTAFPPAENDADGVAAVAAIERYWEAGLPVSGLTVTSDAGGSLPDFDDQGNFLRMGVARPDALIHTVQTLLGRGHALDRILPPFTSIPARHLKLTGKGVVAPGADADLLVLDDEGLHAVMARGAWHVRDGRQVRWGMFERRVA